MKPDERHPLTTKAHNDLVQKMIKDSQKAWKLTKPDGTVSGYVLFMPGSQDWRIVTMDPRDRVIYYQRRNNTWKWLGTENAMGIYTTGLGHHRHSFSKTKAIRLMNRLDEALRIIVVDNVEEMIETKSSDIIEPDLFE